MENTIEKKPHCSDAGGNYSFVSLIYDPSLCWSHPSRDTSADPHLSKHLTPREIVFQSVWLNSTKCVIAVCKWFITAHSDTIWLWVMKHSFRSVASPVIQWSTGENNLQSTNRASAVLGLLNMVNTEAHISPPPVWDSVCVSWTHVWCSNRECVHLHKNVCALERLWRCTCDSSQSTQILKGQI